MNIRSLTRGDGVVIGAAVLLFIASFLHLYESPVFGSGGAPTAWDSLGTVMSLHLAGVIAAALIVVSRTLPAPRKIAGLDLGQFGIALAVFAAWTALWLLVGLNGVDAGGGLIIGFIGALILAAAAVATPLLPQLKTALIGAPRPQAPQPYGGHPAGPTPGYGYPGGPGAYGAQAGQHGQPQPYGTQDSQPGQPQPYGGPQHSQQAQPQHGGGAPAADFAAFWFAVPVARPLFGEDGSPSPIAELAPGTWYLAVEQRGPGLVAQTQDGRRGILQDTSGIQRG
ncbi:hypothetical protein [Streptomyces sp. NPDC051569]|uniref:hypothetical protein n=1 Tax=Streptomyces sp. NPDC051569 TaxID=3365661 RepID=UPI0037B0B380